MSPSLFIVYFKKLAPGSRSNYAFVRKHIASLLCNNNSSVEELAREASLYHAAHFQLEVYCKSLDEPRCQKLHERKQISWYHLKSLPRRTERVCTDEEYLPRQISGNTTLQPALGLFISQEPGDCSLNKGAARITGRPQGSTFPGWPKMAFPIKKEKNKVIYSCTFPLGKLRSSS